MTRSFFAVCLVLCSATVSAAPQAGNAPAPIVFFDIAGPDSARLQKFYADLFGWNMTAGGTFTTGATTPMPATIRQDPAATLIYIGVEDITATLGRIVAEGGSVQFPRLVVPGRVVIGMFKDPAGNSVGLVELRNGKPVVP